MKLTRKAPEKMERVSVICEDAGVKCEAMIRNASNGALKLSLSHMLVAGAAAEVSFAPGFSETGTVLYSKRAGDRFVAVIALSSFQCARRESRTRLNEKCLVSEISSSSPAVPGTVVDISKSGLGLVVKNPAKLGALLSVGMTDLIVIGEVRHCSLEDEHHYRLGLSIEYQTERHGDSAAPDASNKSNFGMRGIRRLPVFFGFR